MSDNLKELLAIVAIVLGLVSCDAITAYEKTHMPSPALGAGETPQSQAIVGDEGKPAP